MRIVVKVGTSTLAYPTGRLNIRHAEELVKVLSDLKNEGHEVILVSSGAIGMGVGKLSLPARPKDTTTKQACAAVGQCELMYTYDRLFSAYDHTVAQILLTGVDVEHTERRVNIQNTLTRLLERLGLGARLPRMEHGQAAADGLPRVVVVGFGPVGRSLCRIVRAHGMLPVVVEANIDTVRRLRGLGRPAVHGDATQAEVLREAGLAQAQALLLSAPAIPAREVVPIARAINPDLRIFVNTPFASEADSLRSMGVEGAFSGEREVALSMSRFLLDDLGVGRTGLEAELERVREVFDEGPATQKS